MKINLQSKNFELTETVSNYAIKRVTNLEKFLSVLESNGGEMVVQLDLGRSTGHHRAGEIFHADCLVKVSGEKFYSSAEAQDIYAAIDQVKDSLLSEIKRRKERRQTLFRRGAASVKKMFKGLSARNPFTGKY